jgi:hypothetical protein
MINISMRARELLTERIINLHTADQKAKYVDQVWDILQQSYAKIGGFKSASSPQELIEIPGYWKLVKRADQITAVNLYRKVPHTTTFKTFASGAVTDGNTATNQGRSDYMMLKRDDVKQERSWAEVSGSAEKIAKRLNSTPIPNKFAAYLTDKEILSYNPDGYHYTRLIMGEPHEKIIYGFIGLTDNQKKSLENNGLDINELPYKKA